MEPLDVNSPVSDLSARLEALVADEPMLQLFRFSHLGTLEMQKLSSAFAYVAVFDIMELPRNPERSAALRKLREAKDCAVTALLWKP